METNLRPLRLGEILDRTALLYRTNFLLFAGISAVLAAGVLLLNLVVIGVMEALHMSQLAAATNGWFQGVGWVSFLMIMVIGEVATAANNRAVAWVYLGEPATISSAWGSVLSKFGRYVWIGIAKVAIAWTPVILLYGAFQAISIHFQQNGVLPKPGEVPPPGAAPMAGTMTFVLIAMVFFVLIWPALIYSVFMALRFALALPASVVENLPMRRALRRSIDLSKGARGRILVLWLLVIVIELVVMGVTQTFFVAYSMRHHFEIPLGLRILQQLIAFLTNTFIGPILATGTCLFYFDQRVRKEGYDIEWMMQAAGLEQLSAPAGEPAPETAAEMAAAPADAAPEPRESA